MCESKAVVVKGSKEELILDDVVMLEILGDRLRLVNIEGKEKLITEYRLGRIDFIGHKIYLVPKE
ncbi:MAG TPA: CooT family nickel-binding protein [Acidilobales archaeon]|nr:CooT family nickel-binding protein [Acidilobales archaeon]